MTIIRNPFRRNPGDPALEDASRPGSSNGTVNGAGGPTPKSNGQKVGPLDVRPNGDKQPAEYKLSEINDSGVFMPPSPPPEKPRYFSTRSYGSTNSSNYRSVFNENEPFNISRESFDSYRRSFVSGAHQLIGLLHCGLLNSSQQDISARSPVIGPDTQKPRQSLDSRSIHLSQPATKGNHINPPEAEPEDKFEDIGLNDEIAKPKKQGIFSRFGHSSSEGPNEAQNGNSRPSSSHFGSHQLFGRRRGASGQGAELGSMPRHDVKSPAPAPEIRVGDK
ncbi:MAG: hypothetical protein M1831_005776 [Alyxoria varia]|nr:MAG: hypothetical protein M1831_005776 [Alyxoria varia]